MLLAQNCLDVGGLTGCDLILICLYGLGVGGLTLIGGSLRGLAGDALTDAIRAGIEAKPAHHNLAPGVRPSDTPRDMNEIGG